MILAADIRWMKIYCCTSYTFLHPQPLELHVKRCKVCFCSHTHSVTPIICARIHSYSASRGKPIWCSRDQVNTFFHCPARYKVVLYSGKVPHKGHIQWWVSNLEPSSFKSSTLNHQAMSPRWCYESKLKHCFTKEITHQINYLHNLSFWQCCQNQSSF